MADVKITISEKELNRSSIIKVIGIGGGGNNAINYMVKMGLTGAELVAANTDRQVLDNSLAPTVIQLGPQLTKGLGAGGDPEIGRKAMEESADEFRKVLEGAQMVYLTAGMGGGTGTGGIPVAAEIAKSMGLVTVAIVTKPFSFEGKYRMEKAEQGIKELKEKVDTLIVIPNDKILEMVDVPMEQAFSLADEVLYKAVKGILDLKWKAGRINLDFADIKTVMSERGYAIMGIGVGEGDNRALEAAKNAIFSPLLDEYSIKGAKAVLVNIKASEGILTSEVNDINRFIQSQAKDGDHEPNYFFGLTYENELGDKIEVTLIATGISRVEKSKVVTPPKPEKVNSEVVELKIEDRDIPAYERLGINIFSGLDEDVINSLF